MQIKTLEEKMIFFLASLPMRSFEKVKTIYQLHSEGKLNTTVRSKSQRGITSIPDLKGSSFKPFRALDEETVYQILSDVAEKKYTFLAAVTKCKDIKALKKIQTSFVSLTRCHDWDEAVEKYPDYTTVQMLEPFKKLQFNKQAPAKFVKYCQQALTSTTTADKMKDHGSYYTIVHQHCIGVMWRQSLFDVAPNMVKVEDISACKGFNLSILDLSDCSTSDKV